MILRMFTLILITGTLLWFRSSSSAFPQDVDTLLKESWLYYKQRFMVNNERVSSNNYGGTITEGQSYALLKAVWMDDRKTFDKTWNWTQKHMANPDSHLLGWHWGKKENGQFGLISHHNATDGDQDIAYALLLAGEKWKHDNYIQDAQKLITDLWRFNVSEVQGKYYLNPGTWEGFYQGYLSINPSYFAPYVYRKFAEYDIPHRKGWLELADNIYPTLAACSNLTAQRLPPNWCAVDYNTGQIIYSDHQGKGSRDFSYDAYRVFWRMAMDAKAGSPEALAYLQSHQALLKLSNNHHQLADGYTWQGEPLDLSSNGFILSAAMAQAHALDPKNPMAIYRHYLQPHYHSDGYWFNRYNDYLHSVIWLHLYTLRN